MVDYRPKTFIEIKSNIQRKLFELNDRLPRRKETIIFKERTSDKTRT